LRTNFIQEAVAANPETRNKYNSFALDQDLEHPSERSVRPQGVRWEEHDGTIVEFRRRDRNSMTYRHCLVRVGSNHSINRVEFDSDPVSQQLECGHLRQGREVIPCRINLVYIFRVWRDRIEIAVAEEGGQYGFAENTNVFRAPQRSDVLQA
jgi:diaminopimelate epimerase